jgi:hypothetical protein
MSPACFKARWLSFELNTERTARRIYTAGGALQLQLQLFVWRVAIAFNRRTRRLYVHETGSWPIDWSFVPANAIVTLHHNAICRGSTADCI